MNAGLPGGRWSGRRSDVRSGTPTATFEFTAPTSPRTARDQSLDPEVDTFTPGRLISGPFAWWKGILLKRAPDLRALYAAALDAAAFVGRWAFDLVRSSIQCGVQLFLLLGIPR